MQLHHGLLPRTAAPGRVTAALRLRLDAHRPHVLHAHAEDLLHGLADLSLVRAVVHPERVLVGREERVALLGHDRPDDHRAGVHAAARSGARAMVVRYSIAAGESTSDMWKSSPKTASSRS